MKSVYLLRCSGCTLPGTSMLCCWQSRSVFNCFRGRRPVAVGACPRYRMLRDDVVLAGHTTGGAGNHLLGSTTGYRCRVVDELSMQFGERGGHLCRGVATS